MTIKILSHNPIFLIHLFIYHDHRELAEKEERERRDLELARKLYEQERAGVSEVINYHYCSIF